MSRFVAGSRGSDLALWQTRHVMARLAEVHAARKLAVPQCELKIISTRGDRDQRDYLAGQLEKGFFTEELEAELRQKTIDFAVHSLKDLPTRLPEDLGLGATLERASPNDLLLARPEAVVEQGPDRLPLKAGAKVGSSSKRREALIQHYAPSVSAGPLRGNVPTRVEKLRKGQYDAVVLAAAGVERLELPLGDFAVFRLNPKRWVSAPGQGSVGVECRKGDARVLELLSAIHHEPSATATELERSFLRVLEGGCTTPFGAYAEGDHVYLGVATPSGWKGARVERSGAKDPNFANQTVQALSAGRLPEMSNDEWLFRRK